MGQASGHFSLSRSAFLRNLRLIRATLPVPSYTFNCFSPRVIHLSTRANLRNTCSNWVDGRVLCNSHNRQRKRRSVEVSRLYMELRIRQFVPGNVFKLVCGQLTFDTECSIHHAHQSQTQAESGPTVRCACDVTGTSSLQHKYWTVSSARCPATFLSLPLPLARVARGVAYWKAVIRSYNQRFEKARSPRLQRAANAHAPFSKTTRCRNTAAAPVSVSKVKPACEQEQRPNLGYYAGIWAG